MDSVTLIIIGGAALVIIVGWLRGHKPEIGASRPESESIWDQRQREDWANDSFMHRDDD